MILIIKHIVDEGPGTIEDFFRNASWPLKIVNVFENDSLPDGVEGIGAVISLGGPMNVHEEEKYPFLKSEDVFLKEAVKREIPVLGVCLGAQLLAKACGAKVVMSPLKEIGWYPVSLTDEGKADPLFEEVPSVLDVFQWHEDMFEIPPGGVLLASSRQCPNQAFRFGKNAYGLQFHIEVTPDMIESWLSKFSREYCAGADPKDMLIESHKRKESYRKQADSVYLNFARIL
ncbi:MAG: type 1 glutamine amidotransferase [Candidatus Omnitrophota bacterium]|jgi:GMP synthase-like glutamine amidotransferase